jgi:hypothetical protein
MVSRSCDPAAGVMVLVVWNGWPGIGRVTGVVLIGGFSRSLLFCACRLRLLPVLVLGRSRQCEAQDSSEERGVKYSGCHSVLIA